MAVLFSFEGVAVAFADREVLAGVDLAIPEGGCTVLVGPSGSRKSTLLRLCKRLEAPTAGVLRFRGEDVASLDPLRHRRRVGMVFQRPVAFGGSVLDNLRVARPALPAGELALVALGGGDARLRLVDHHPTLFPTQAAGQMGGAVTGHRAPQPALRVLRLGPVLIRPCCHHRASFKASSTPPSCGCTGGGLRRHAGPGSGWGGSSLRWRRMM